jgi:hypothetical protein
MRFKYYMRGLGTGVILATLLFTVGNHFGSVAKEEPVEETVEEIIGETIEESTDTGSETVTEEPEAIEAEDVKEEAEAEVTEEEPVDETVKYVSFTVHGGDSSEIVSSNLHEAGIIDSVDNFNKYLKTVGLDHKIQAGTFYVKVDSSYDDLAALLVNKDARTTTPPKNE